MACKSKVTLKFWPKWNFMLRWPQSSIKLLNRLDYFAFFDKCWM